MAQQPIVVRLGGKHFLVSAAELRAFLQLALLRKTAPPTPAWPAQDASSYEKQPPQLRVDLGEFHDERWRLLESLLARPGSVLDGAPAPPSPVRPRVEPPPPVTALTVWYFHGKHGSPTGEKAEALRQRCAALGVGFEAMDFRGMENPDERVERVLAHARPPGEVLLVGSSMGGYVAAMTAGALEARGMLLLAPAFFREGYRMAEPDPPRIPTHVIHAWNDDVVPVGASLRWCEPRRGHLELVEGTHQLREHIPRVVAALDALVQEVRAGDVAAAG